MSPVSRLACMALLALPAASKLDAPPEQAGPPVTMGTGSLEDVFTEEAPGAVFRGVPFAQPPVARLRWHEPLAVLPWDSVKDAALSGPACFQ